MAPETSSTCFFNELVAVARDAAEDSRRERPIGQRDQAARAPRHIARGILVDVFTRLLERFARWWTTFRAPPVVGHAHRVTFVGSTDDYATAVAAGDYVLVGEPGFSKWLRFACPCGCGETVALNLMPSHRPRWQVDLELDGTISVRPSVVVGSCGSHFFVRRSGIEWARPTPPNPDRES